MNHNILKHILFIGIKRITGLFGLRSTRKSSGRVVKSDQSITDYQNPADLFTISVDNFVIKQNKIRISRYLLTNG